MVVAAAAIGVAVVVTAVVVLASIYINISLI